MHAMLKNRVLPVLAGAVIVVGGLNVAAYAANGHPLLLGHSNSETKPATVANSGKGPALSLRSRAKSAPLAVSNSKLVKKLNADKVDGLDGKSLQNTVYTFSIPDATTLPTALALQGVPKGKYVASFDIAASTASASPMICYLDETTSHAQVLAYGASSGSFAVASATGFYTVRAGHPPILTCNGGTQVLPASTFQSHVVLTKVDIVKHGSVAPATRTGGRTPSLLTH